MDTDDERIVLKTALDTFSAPMLAFTKSVDAAIDQQAGNKVRPSAARAPRGARSPRRLPCP